MAGLLVELIRPSLRFVGLGSFLCHTDSFPHAGDDCQPCGFQTAPLPNTPAALTSHSQEDMIAALSSRATSEGHKRAT